MSKQFISVLSITLLFVVLFVALISVTSLHEHNCEHTLCVYCEFIKNLNDGYLTLLIFSISLIFIFPFISSMLTYMRLKYKSRILSPTKLRVLLLN